MQSIGAIANQLFKNSRPEPEKGDYYGEDGLLYCGKCHTPRETKIQNQKGSLILPVICKCQKEADRQREEYDKQQQRLRKIESLKINSLMESRFKNVNFTSYKQTDGNKKARFMAERYVKSFDEMYKENQGLLFYGTVGTGKSYTAACIANELIQKMHTVIMTSFVKILQELQDMQTDEKKYIGNLNSAQLLIIDDLGAERNTDYALEKVYNVIDSRYIAKKPLILTTNMTVKEMMGTLDLRYKRIYDRIFEMCYPVKLSGDSWRKQEAAERFDKMKRLMEG